MGWGSAFASAWDSATDAARSVANAVAQTAQSAYDYMADKAAQAYQAAESFVHDAVSGLIAAAQWAYDQAREFFGPKPAGGGVQPCPNPPTPVPTPTPTPTPGPTPTPTPTPTPPPPVEDINIVSVDWLHGDDVTTISACDQFVNLPRDAKWLADSGIANIDRLSLQPRFLVKFDRPQTASFQYRLIPIAGGTPDYTATEEGRNAHFVASPKEWQMSSAPDGTAVMAGAVSLVAGGGYKFQVEAKDDKGKVVRSGIITTKRLFWYVELPMNNLPSVLASTASVDSEFGNHHIVLKQLSDLAIPHQENIGSNADSATLATNVDNAVNGNATARAKAPYLLRIAYTDHLAVKNPNRPQRVDGVTVGAGRAAVEIPVSSVGLRSGDGDKRRWLWNNIVTGESWFVSAQYTPDGGGAAVAIPADKVTQVGTGSSSRSISVDVTGLPAGTGTIVVNVDVVDRMRGGLAVGGAANICICTRAFWNTVPDGEQACTVIHETGHKVQMVVNGTGIMPDRAATQYDNKGHVGSHCFNGCADGLDNYNTTENAAASTCVMFGTVNSKVAFCGNCAPAVKKVDLAAGF